MANTSFRAATIPNDFQYPLFLATRTPMTLFLNLFGLSLITLGSIAAALSAPTPLYHSDGSVFLVGNPDKEKRVAMHRRQKWFPRFLVAVGIGASLQAVALLALAPSDFRAMNTGEAVAFAEWVGIVWAFVGNNAANIIALAATAFVAYQAWLTRKHNRLSVRPHLQIHTDIRRGVAAGPNTIDHYTAELRNDGLGPAITIKWRLFLDGKEQINPTAKGIDNIVKALAPNALSVTSYYMGEDHVMRSNDSRILLAVRVPSMNPEQLKTLEAQLARLDFLIEYTSMYGDKCKPVDTRE